MKGLIKQLSRVISVMLVICLLTVTVFAAPTENCPGNCAHSAAIGSTHYQTLKEALSAAKAGNTVTLLKNLSFKKALTIEKSLVLDLGGNTLTGSVCFTTGGILRNGTLTATADPALTVSDCTVTIEKDAVLNGCGSAPAVLLQAAKDGKSRLNVSGKISGKDTAPVVAVQSEEGSCELYILEYSEILAEENIAVSFDAAGKLEISDGTIQAKKDLLTIHIAQDRTTEIAITGGKLLSDEGKAIVITADKKAEIPTDFVTGGTYRKVPSEYVPAYCKIRTNSDQTYTVISAYALTFQANGGSGTMAPVKVKCGSSYTLPDCGFGAAEGMDFAGWKIGSKTYAPGDTFTPKKDTAVTAQWKTHTHFGGKATCLKKAVCEGCGKSYGSLGSHNLNYVSAYAPSCTKQGMDEHSVCSTCGSCFVSGTEVSASSLSTPALGHSWETLTGTPAGCTENGLKQHQKCATCGALQADGIPVTEADLVIPATGHTMESVAASQATCAEPGIQAHDHCSLCQQDFVNGTPVASETLTTATASHVLSDWVSDGTYHWKSCVDCQEVFRQKSHADADSNGVCDECGYEMSAPKTETQPAETAGFSWLFLAPLIAAVGIAVPLVLKKRK